MSTHYPGFWLYAAVVPGATVSVQGVNADLVSADVKDGETVSPVIAKDLVVAKIGITDEPSPYRRLQQGLIQCMQTQGYDKEVLKLSEEEAVNLMKTLEVPAPGNNNNSTSTSISLPKPSSDLGYCYIPRDAVLENLMGTIPQRSAEELDEVERKKQHEKDLRLALDKALLGGKLEDHRFCKGVGSSIHWSRQIFGHKEVVPAACTDLFVLTRKDFDALFIKKMMITAEGENSTGGFVPKKIAALTDLTTAKDLEDEDEKEVNEGDEDEKEPLITGLNIRKVIYTIEFKRWDPSAAGTATVPSTPQQASNNGGGKKKGKKGKAEAQVAAPVVVEPTGGSLPSASVQVVWTGIKNSAIRNWYMASEEDISAANVESDDDEEDEDEEERKRKTLQIGASEAF